jgi:Na+/phosphate symporter
MVIRVIHKTLKKDQETKMEILMKTYNELIKEYDKYNNIMKETDKRIKAYMQQLEALDVSKKEDKEKHQEIVSMIEDLDVVSKRIYDYLNLILDTRVIIRQNWKIKQGME